MKPLRDLYAEHSGKVSDKWSLYIEAYDRYFDSFRNMEVNILEIGAQNGGSLEIWLKYFPNARTVTGVDINPACATLTFEDPRIQLIVGDANETDTASRILDRATAPFDIIIDDGSHKSSDVVKSFALYFPKLATGGIYIMEDVHCSYWSEFEGGLYEPLSTISFAKRLADLSNFEHWRDEISRSEFLTAFSSKYGCSFDEDTLNDVDSVEFSNSLVAIHKRRWRTDGLGQRNVVGQISQVVDAQQLSAQSQSQLREQVQSGAAFHVPIEVAFEERAREIAEVRADLCRSANELTALKQTERELAAALQDNQVFLATARSQSEASEARIETLQNELTAAKGKVAAMEDSASWRMTAPVRTLLNTIRRGK